MKIPLKNFVALACIIVFAIATSWMVRRYHVPGHLDVVAAQAMDMSQMRPPTGAAPVGLASIKNGSLSDAVTYTGSVLAFNEQDISPRITGTILSLPVYPGDTVHAGQLVAQLDSAEVSAKAQEAMAETHAAQIDEQIAHITHHLHHGAELSQARSQLAAAQQGVPDAEAETQADQDAITDAEAGAQSAQANADYWKTEIAREKELADAGAASQQEYQNELAEAQAAFSAVSQAQAKVRQATATATAGEAKVIQAQRQVDVAGAGVGMAQADIAVANGQAQQAGAGVAAAEAASREAGIIEGYARITSPANGVVIARPVAPGTLVQPGAVILKVEEIDRVRIQANVATSDLNGIHPGSPVEIVAQDASPAILAKVTAVFPSADSDTRTAIVEAVIDNPNHRLLPGGFVSMRISLGKTDSNKLLVPTEAIVSQGGQSYVWIAKQAAGSAQIYECVICHIHYTAAQAKKFHYRDPMEGGKLIPLKGGPAATSGPATAHEVPVQTQGSDGARTEVTSDELSPDEQIVAHGQAGLTEGARIVATAWGPSGPKSLPDAASASGGLTVYRCEICGMTYSAADAKKNHFIDPMDGGKLAPVKSDASS